MRAFQSLEKVNKFWVQNDAKERWANEISLRSPEYFNKSYAEFPFYHNPLYDAAEAMRWICERYLPAFRYVDGKRFNRIIEIGCAHGLSTWLLSDACDEAYGVDVSNDMVKNAQILFPECYFSAVGFNDFLSNWNVDADDLVIDSYGPWGSDMQAIIRKKNLRWLHIGYRCRRFNEMFNWANKLKGKHISFEATLVGDEIGFHKGYASYFFSRYYMRHLKHSVSHGYWPQI